MTKEDRAAEETVNIQQDLYGQHLQLKMPNSRIMKSGPYSVVTMENSTHCFQQVAENVFDLNGTAKDGSKTDQQGLTADELEHLLLTAYRAENPDSIPTSPTWKDNEDLEKEKANEQTATGGVAGYNPAKAFSSPHQKINRAVEQSKREGWTNINESAEWQLKELVKHFQAILPIEADDISADDYGNINIESNELRIWIKPKGANLFDVQTCVGDTPQPRQVALPMSKMVQFIFDAASVEKETATLVGNLGKENKKTMLRDSDNEADADDDDLTISDAFSVLKELAVETGAYGGDDILRNKTLYDLRGLVVSKNNSVTKKPFVTLREQLAERFNRPPMDQKTNLREQVTPRNLRAENVKNGAPVSLNENRNVCCPYKNTLGGKVLIMDPVKGAVLVDKTQLQEGMKLSWDKEQGAVMVPATEETKRPSWKPYWQQQYD